MIKRITQRASVRSAMAAVVCAGFIMLAVFGALVATGDGGQSLLSCVASSAGLVCDSHGGALAAFHELSSFLAVTASTHIAQAVFAALLVAAAMITASRLLTLPLLFIGRVSAPVGAEDRANPSAGRLRRWLSFFELSPGR